MTQMKYYIRLYQHQPWGYITQCQMTNIHNWRNTELTQTLKEMAAANFKVLSRHGLYPLYRDIASYSEQLHVGVNQMYHKGKTYRTVDQYSNSTKQTSS
jgi:hypothetical protein